MDIDRGRTQRGRYGHGLLDPAEIEAMQRKRLRAEEYKRALDAQVEEQRQRREQEKAEWLAEEHRVIWDRKVLQQKAQVETLGKRQKEEQKSKTEEPGTSSGVKQNCRHGHNMDTLLDLARIEAMQKKQAKDEEYKRDLLAQMEEQRQRREREKVERLAAEQVEEQRVIRDRKVLQQNSLLETQSKRQEDSPSLMTEEPRTWSKHSRRYAHNLSSLLDPAQLEIMQKKQLRDEEYKRDLDAQVEEQRQRREREKAERLAEEQAEELRVIQEREILQQKAQAETLSKRQKQERSSQKIEEPHTTNGVKQNNRYTRNLSCLVDPAQVEINQRQRTRNEDHKLDLDAQVEDQRQRRKQEKVERLAVEQAEEQRVIQERKVLQQKAQVETLGKKQKEELRLQKTETPERSSSDETHGDKHQSRIQRVSKNGRSNSRHSHYKDKESLSPPGQNTWEVFSYPTGNFARLEGVAPRAVAVRIVYTKDAAVQTDSVIGSLWEPVGAPIKDRLENRQPSPPVPALLRQFKHQELQQLIRRASQGHAEANETGPPPASEPPAQEANPRAQENGPSCKRPPPPLACDGLLRADHVQQVIEEGLSQLHQDLQQKQREMEMAL